LQPVLKRIKTLKNKKQNRIKNNSKDRILFLKIFFQFIKEYGKGFKLKLFFIAIFSLVMGLFEFLGLALIFPFVMILSGNDGFLKSSSIGNTLASMNFPLDIKSLAFILCIAIVLIYIIKDISMMLCIRYQNNVIADWQAKIYSDVLHNLFLCPYLKLNKLSFGDKSALLGGALTSSVSNFMHKVILLLSNGIIAFCILAFLFYKFALPAFVAAVFLSIFVYIEQLFFKKRAKYYGTQQLETQRELGSLFESTMKGIKEIKISKNKEFFAESIIKKYNLTNHYSKLLASNSAYPLYVTEIGIIISFGILAGLIFFFQKISSQYLVSSLAVVAAVILRLVPNLNKIQSSMYAINQSRGPIRWFMNTSKTVKNLAQKETEGKDIPFENKIKLQNVSFSYLDEKEKPALKDVNLEIKKGEFVGIVGLSGSGKTTLMDILSGLNLPREGKFYIDNLEITSENMRSWQRHISILPQEFFLMPMSVLSNVTFGEKPENIDTKRVVEALKKAEIYEETKDLNKVPELSHGQRHRLALARAFYQNADVLFLDEATSSLDIETESRISETIAKLKGAKTIIAIAHRLSTLKECDAVIYMKEGKIIDKGSFLELKQKYPDFENMLELSTFTIQ